MGGFELGSTEDNLQGPDTLRIAKISGVILAISGLLAPVIASWNGYLGNFTFSIQSLLWSLYLGTYGSGFLIDPVFAFFSLFPILILRLVPVSAIVRYYQRKTTRRRAIIGIIVGDIFFLAESVLFFVNLFIFMVPIYYFPLPIQMLVGFFILWKISIPEPTKPWDSANETKPWWEKKSGYMTESSDTKDDENKLW
jgi:hypothetical protein